MQGKLFACGAFTSRLKHGRMRGGIDGDSIKTPRRMVAAANGQI